MLKENQLSERRKILNHEARGNKRGS